MNQSVRLEWAEEDFAGEPHLRALVEAMGVMVEAASPTCPRGLADVAILRLSLIHQPMGHHITTTESRIARSAPVAMDFHAGSASAQEIVRRASMARERVFCGLMALNALIVVDMQPVLRTSIVRWLERRKLYMPTVVVTLLCFTCAFFLNSPELVEIDVPAIHGGSDSTVVLKKFTLLHVGVDAVFWWLFMILILHRAPRQLLYMACCSFDCIVIMLSGTILTVVVSISRLSVGFAAGVMTPMWACTQILSSCLVFAPISIFMGAFDGFQFPVKFKMLSASLGIAGYGWTYMDYRFFSLEWEKREICAWVHCGNLHSIALMSGVHVMVFLGKMLVSYASGQAIGSLSSKFRFVSTSRADVSPPRAGKVSRSLFHRGYTWHHASKLVSGLQRSEGARVDERGIPAASGEAAEVHENGIVDEENCVDSVIVEAVAHSRDTRSGSRV